MENKFETKTVQLKYELLLLLSLFIHGLRHTDFTLFYRTVLFPSPHCSKLKYFILKSLSRILYSIQLIHSKHIFLTTLLYYIITIVQVFFQFSSLNIAYPILRFNLFYLKLLVPMSDNCRPPSCHTFL